MMNTKVLMLVPDLKGGGGVANYYRFSPLRNHQNYTYLQVNSPEQDSYFMKFFFFVWIYFQFLWLLPGHQVVYVNPGFHAKSFFRDMTFITVANLTGRKTVAFFRGWDRSFEKKIDSWFFLTALFRWTYGRVDTILVLGTVFQKRLSRFGVSSHVTFFRETTMADNRYFSRFEVEEKFSSFDQTVNLLFISRLVKGKGAKIALQCYEKLLDFVPERQTLHFTIAGDGPLLEPLKKYVREKDLPRVSFEGYVRNQKKHHIYKKSHVLVFPTYYQEGLPTTILEAMLYGLPVVTRPIAGIPDEVENGENGILIESKNPDVFAQKIKKLIKDPEKIRKMSSSNQQKGRNHYTPERVTRRIHAIVQFTMGVYEGADQSIPREIKQRRLKS